MVEHLAYIKVLLAELLRELLREPLRELLVVELLLGLSA